MVARVLKFHTSDQRMRRTTAAALFDQLRLFSDDELPPTARAALMNALHRLSKPDDAESIWPGGFTMLSRQQTAAVWDAIRALPADLRPHLVRHAFDLVLLNLRQDTGEVMLTRDQLADAMKVNADHVSRVMGTLEKMGVIRRERRRVEGLRGPGMAVYFINPHVAWNGSLNARKEEAKATPEPALLRLLEGGKTA